MQVLDSIAAQLVVQCYATMAMAICAQGLLAATQFACMMAAANFF